MPRTLPRDLDAAQESAGDALRAAVDGGYRCEEALAHRLLGRCAAARSQPVETAARLGQALEMQSEIRAVLEADRTCRVITDVRPSVSNVS